LKDEWTPEPLWIFLRREKSFRSAGIKIPDSPARSKVTKPTSLALLPKWVWRDMFSCNASRRSVLLFTSLLVTIGQ
jgi:hypothetical protein